MIFCKIRTCCIIFILANLLTGCSDDDYEVAGSPPGEIDQASGGIWVGTWVGPSGGESNVVGFSTDEDPATGEARFSFILFPSLIQIAGTAKVNGFNITGGATAYTTEPGDTFPSGNTTTGIMFSGTLQERATLNAEWQIDEGESGSFSVSYDDQHKRGADLAKLDDLWVAFDINDNPLGLFDIMDGMIFRQTAVCTTTGSIKIPDQQFNVYEWESTITSNTPNSCPIAGSYTGLGVLADYEDGNFAYIDDEFDVLLNSPSRAAALRLVRDSRISP